MYKSKEKIEKWLNKYGIHDYVIHDDLSVDVNNSVILNAMGLKILPVQFGTVNGDFSVENNYLESLIGCPHTVGTSFDCSYNNITSLEGSPKFVASHFDCSHNKVITLEFCPESVGGHFCCSCNEIVTLEYYPKNVNGNFNCKNNPIQYLTPTYDMKDWQCNLQGNFQHFGSYIKEFEKLYNYENIDFSVKEMQRLLLKKKLEEQLVTQPSKSKNKI